MVSGTSSCNLSSIAVAPSNFTGLIWSSFRMQHVQHVGCLNCWNNMASCIQHWEFKTSNVLRLREPLKKWAFSSPTHSTDRGSARLCPGFQVIQTSKCDQLTCQNSNHSDVDFQKLKHKLNPKRPKRCYTLKSFVFRDFFVSSAPH